MTEWVPFSWDGGYWKRGSDIVWRRHPSVKGGRWSAWPSGSSCLAAHGFETIHEAARYCDEALEPEPSFHGNGPVD